ncbi:MAG: hypothetical protein KAH23_05890, partial [Kiritimatiellae bacterium]|nr:hypothetical protein [Kiritimatiellia bacterium]
MSRHDATHVAIAHPRLLSLLALAACVFCIYSVSVGHNFLFDEKSIIENNPYIKNLSLVPQLLNQGFFHYDGVPEFSWEHRYRPLTSLTFAADYAFWGLNPMGFNLTNTTLHLLVCVVLFMLLFKAFKSSAVAFLATLFYAVHPIHVEAITYIASRSDPLGTLLMLSAMWCYWNSRFKAGLLFYALGLFAKENIIFLPAYLLLMDICLMKRTWRHMFFGLAPYIAVATVFIALRASIVPIPLPPRPDFPGAIYRVMSMGPSVVSYLKCILFPSGFEFGKQIAFTESMFDPAVLISFIIYMLLLIIWALTWRKRIVFFGIGFFLVSLFPCLQWIAFTPVWAEHYLYIPLIGLIFVFGFFINIVLKSRNPLIRNTSLYVYLAFICFLSIKTYSRNDLYNSPLKFYQCLASGESPYAAHGLQFIGIHALDNERPKDAYELFRRAQSVKFMPTTENFLGISALRLGRHQDALQHFQTAYNSMQDEGYRLNMGVALMRMKQF